MTHYQLGFANITCLEECIFEIVVAPSIEVDACRAAHMHRFFDGHIHAPSHFLINKQNDYSLSLDAMRNVGNHPAVSGIAFLLFRPSTAKIVEMQQKIMLNRNLDVASFWNRDQALQWMRSRRAESHRSLQA